MRHRETAVATTPTTVEELLRTNAAFAAGYHFELSLRYADEAREATDARRVTWCETQAKSETAFAEALETILAEQNESVRYAGRVAASKEALP